MSESPHYKIPEGQLVLDGPIKRPEPGTLPLRGDVAHIALARKFLVPHYVVPDVLHVGRKSAALHLAMDADSDILVSLEPGTAFEALDITENWVWGCCGPDGPTGYIVRSAFGA
ncbi:hypothetical protein OAS19_04670 [Altererythrobacter sp.]|nr:hypothetical protein [Altererythrobacter sp.]